jgi:drug/metabolite transporter (DMT)-like permease
MSRSLSIVEWLLLLALAAVWSFSFFFAKLALGDLPPLSVVLGRVGIAALALLLVLRLSGLALPLSRAAWGAFLGMALLNNVIPFSLLFWGQTAIESALAAILNATTPLFAVIGAHFLTSDERATPGKLAGVGFGIAGVAVMLGADALAGIGREVAAQLACLAAAASYALAGIFGRRFRRLGIAPLTTAAGQVTTSAVLMLPLVLLVDRPWAMAPPGWLSLAALLGLALVSTALAYVLYFRILATAGATNLLLVTFLIPIGALWLGIGVLGESLAPRHFAGMILILLGLAAIDGRMLRWLAGMAR